MVVNADAPLAFLLYKAEELPSYLRPHVAHRLVVCESQRLRSNEHRDAKHHQKYNFIQIHLYKLEFTCFFFQTVREVAIQLLVAIDSHVRHPKVEQDSLCH